MAAKTTYPPGGTWFDTLKKSFVDVPVNANNDNAIETTAFLEAAESLTTLFGKQAMGSQNTEHLPVSIAKPNNYYIIRCPGLSRIYSCEE